MNSTPPQLPGSSPPVLLCKTDEKWLLEEDIEVTQFMPDDDENEDVTETASRLRLQADILVEKDDKNETSNLLQPIKIPKRRRSPITVQEWVASLPVHHILQRENLEASEDTCYNESRKDSTSEPFNTCPLVTVSVTDETNEDLIVSKEKSKIDQDELDNTNTLDIDPASYEGLRRLSATLDEMEEKANDSQSEDEDKMESYGEESIRSEKIPTEDSKSNEADEDSIQLGEEASLHFDSDVFVKDHNVNFTPKRFASLADRRRLLLQSHKEHASFQSDFSAKSTVSSVDSVLMSRNVDPSEFLLELGFGGPSTSILARIPARFFTKSHAKGISVASFLKSQEELVEKFDSGFSGYRGLSGPPDSRPSKLVEKIIERIRVQERLKRQATGTSLTSSIWPSSTAVKPNFKRKLRLARFASIVNQAMDVQNAGPQGLKGARAFRKAVHSVLSPANREHMAEEARRADRLAQDRHKKKLVIGGKTFSINEDDLSVVDEISDSKPITDELSELPTSIKPPNRRLSKRDSSMSILSSCSVESDWSDEELEELEKMFGSIQHKSSMAENTSSPAESVDSAESRWRNLKKSRRLAMAKLQNQPKSFKSSLSSSSSNEAELIFTRSVTSSEDACKEMERLLVLEANHHQIAKADDRVPRRFSQHTKRV